MDDGSDSKVELPLEQGGEETLQSDENSNKNENIGEKIRCVGENDSDEQSRQVENSSSIPVKGEDLTTKASSPAKTLAEVPSASGDLHCSYEVPVEYELQAFEAEKNKDKVCTSKVGDLRGTAHQAAPAQRQNEQESLDGASSPESSPTSATQSISSIQTPHLPKQMMSPAEDKNRSCVPEGQRQSPKPLSIVPVQRTPYPDGYNWRKYGQKQVKSPEGSRSYYRCTYSDCCAKKIECADKSNRVIEIVYRSSHNHDPPEKLNSARGNRVSPSILPVNESESSSHPVRALNDAIPSTSLKDPEQEGALVLDSTEQDSSGSEENPGNSIKQEPLDEHEPRKRLKKNVSSCSGSPLKTGKEDKYVVHAAGDVGISGDGYRWRKYGQKMVKGNPHPRNYYRCTSAGCPVRKHIEMAKDNTSAVIITYKGRHDHDKPVPKKHHGPPSTALVATAAPGSVNSLQATKSEPLKDQVSTAQWSAEKEGELKDKPLEAGGEKTMESARTLLSIGFEIKPC